MSKNRTILNNIAITAAILCACFIFCLAIQRIYEGSALIPSIFVLGVFAIAIITQGYIYSIAASLTCVLAVNFAFTFPFFSFDFTISENLISAIILLAVSCITCRLTAKIKKQEALKAESEKERMRANLILS